MNRSNRWRGNPAGRLALALCLLFFALSSAGSALPAGTGGENLPELRDRPHVVLISIDGCRWDFPDRFPMAALDRLQREGARAERLLPVWPTLTFPNHYTLVTGTAPTRHGLVANNFWQRDRDRWYRLKDRTAVMDGSFYGSEPLWVTAETQGMVSASFFWVGSEAPIGGVQPTHWRPYDKKTPGESRVRQVLDWLAEPAATRPHVITLYFETLDDNAHWYGIGSPEFLAATESLDRWLELLLDGIDALPHGSEVYVVVVSDHGQLPYTDSPAFVLDQHVDLSGWTLVDGGSYVHAWHPDPGAALAATLARRVNATWSKGQALTRSEAIRRWSLRDHPNLPDLVFQADAGHAVLSSEAFRSKIIAGDHGWPPEAPGMHGIFYARGPGIAAGLRLGSVSNVDVHPLLVEWLGLRLPGPLDGEPGRLRQQIESAGEDRP